MQVTDEMIAAAQDATPRWMNATDSEIRYIIEAALDAMPKATGGYVDGDSVRVRLSDASCTYTLPPDMTRGELPPNATVSINLGAADDKTIIETLSRVLGPIKRQSIPVTEPRPLATAEQLHLYLGNGLSASDVAEMISCGDDCVPPFPAPICETRGDKRRFGQPLYDPDAVKAWFGQFRPVADE